MPGIANTISLLSQLRGGAAGAPDSPGGDRLSDLSDFGTNPGALRAKVRLPAGAAGLVPLVVVLHGCTQTADGYDVGAGWSQLAERHGFALLFPEQQRQNNPNLCFNWFAPDDIRRDAGEALSIRQMIAALVDRHGVDPARVFVTGLSAGGAMTAVMLATYPEVFAGGAIIAGLPYGVAAGVPQAMERMRGQGMPEPAELAARVRAASAHVGPWPRLSVWHGSADATVHRDNAEAIVGQWRLVAGLAAAPSRTETVDGQRRRVWCDAAGGEMLEEYLVTGLGHGTPLATASEDGLGRAGAFMLEAGISSTWRIAGFWGLIGEARVATAQDVALAPKPLLPRNRATRIAAEPPSAPAGVGKVIEDALRAAGLMR